MSLGICLCEFSEKAEGVQSKQWEGETAVEVDTQETRKQTGRRDCEIKTVGDSEAVTARQ